MLSVLRLKSVAWSSMSICMRLQRASAEAPCGSTMGKGCTTGASPNLRTLPAPGAPTLMRPHGMIMSRLSTCMPAALESSSKLFLGFVSCF